MVPKWSRNGPEIQRWRSLLRSCRGRRQATSVVKTIAAFLNTNGGTLVIGVNDRSKELMGLDRDLATLGRKDIDGYEQAVRQLLNTSLGAEHSSRIAISFPELDGKPACVVRIPRSPRAVYAVAESDFFVRDGNTTRRLNSEETVGYCADRFKA